MQAKVIKTEEGWEPAFWDEHSNEWSIEPGFALPTKRKAEQALKADADACNKIDATDRLYASQYEYACGYRD